MLRSRLALLGVALGGLLAACDSGSPGSPFPETPGATPVSLAPQTMLLRPAQLAGYERTADSTVDANTLSDQENDPTLVGTLQREGLQVGARATYSDPNKGAPPTPFTTVISQVLLFADAQGAASFFTDEQARRAKPPQGGTLSSLTLPLGGADAVVGLAAAVPASSAGDPPSRALFALIRRGRVIAELLGGGSAVTATDDRFVTLVSEQESQLGAALAS
jgi:hypothetical protein